MNAGPYGPGGDTADRLTAALHARTATLQEDTLTSRAPGFPTSTYARREPLLPRWGWVVAALAVIASVVAGALLGSRTDSSNAPVSLPPAKTATVDNVNSQAKITLLAVRGQTIRLEVDLKNLTATDSSKSWSVGSRFGRGSSVYDFSGMTITIDGLQLNPAEERDGGACVCTTTSRTLTGQETLSVYAVYNVSKTLPKTADVFVPNFGSWLDVPISR